MRTGVSRMRPSTDCTLDYTTGPMHWMTAFGRVSGFFEVSLATVDLESRKNEFLDQHLRQPCRDASRRWAWRPAWGVRHRVSFMTQEHESSPSWHRYRSLLAPEFGVRIERQPVEAWWMVRGHEIHVDDWPAEGPPKGTLILVHGGGGHGRVLAPLADFAAGLGWRRICRATACRARPAPSGGTTPSGPRL